MSISCCKCSQVAVWYYAPTTDRVDRYYCEEHVPSRGCSCNVYGENMECPKDEQGRELPCCEYDFSEEGWNDD